jgi:hypothetical protein
MPAPDGPRIRDIPTIQKVLKDTKLVLALSKWIDRLGPLLKLLGLDFSEAQKLIEEQGGDDVAKLAEELSALPDRFNELFAERGWIAHGLLDLEAARRAISLADSGDIAATDEVLADGYTVDWVRVILIRLRFSEAFRPRNRLAELALIDYGAGRYHASIPVVLALLDGYVQSVGKKHGFHADNADLSAWDSIVGHVKGLKSLHDVVMTSRKTLRTETLSIPYRHGIMHGMDVGYDNQIVAAKTWAMLAAVAEWGIQVERGEKDGRPATPGKTFRELFEQMRQNARLRRRLEEWKPREIVVGRDVPAAGDVSAYGERTPERALVRLLSLWKARNYGAMTDYVWQPRGESRGKLAGEISKAFKHVRLSAFELKEIRDSAGAATHVIARCIGEVAERGAFGCEIDFRLLLEGEDGLALAGDAGTWTVPMLFDSPRRIAATLPPVVEAEEDA